MTLIGERGSALALLCSLSPTVHSPFRSGRPLLTLVSRFCPLLCYTARGPYRTQFNGHGKQGFWALWRECHRVYVC